VGIPEEPAETVTVDGETDSRKLFEAVELYQPLQPDIPRPSAASIKRHKKGRSRPKRHASEPGRNNAHSPKASFSGKVEEDFDETSIRVARRKSRTAPFASAALEQFAVPA
jgi:hypothetical protein